MNPYDEWINTVNSFTNYYHNSILIAEKTFSKLNLKKNLTTSQKIVAYRFLVNLENAKII
jgi:hypothetical protein